MNRFWSTVGIGYDTDMNAGVVCHNGVFLFEINFYLHRLAHNTHTTKQKYHINMNNQVTQALITRPVPPWGPVIPGPGV